MAVAPVLLNYLAGVHWTDYVSPEWAGIIVGGIVMALRAVTTTPIGKAIVVFAIGSALAFGVAPREASAADVNGSAASAVNAYAMKAPASSPCVVGTTATPTSCSGWYVGGGVGGAGTNADIVGNGINGSVFAAGVMPFVDGGYQYVQGNWMFGLDVKGGYQMANSTTLNGAGSNGNGMFFTEMFRVGGNLAGLLGNQAPVTVPPLLANALLTTGGELGIKQRQLPGVWANGFASGAFAEFDISPKNFLTIEYNYINYNNAKFGGVTLNNESVLLTGFHQKF